jgi:hypothetical protein
MTLARGDIAEARPGEDKRAQGGRHRKAEQNHDDFHTGPQGAHPEVKEPK